MSIVELLSEERSAVIAEAFAAMQRSDGAHYKEAGAAFTEERLAGLFDLVVTALRDRQLAPVGEYCDRVAQRRFEAGFGIGEVQTAFNTLEEAMWKRVVAGTPPGELAQSIGLLSTILGFGKDALARRYVALASQRHVPTLDLSELFEGTER